MNDYVINIIYSEMSMNMCAFNVFSILKTEHTSQRKVGKIMFLLIIAVVIIAAVVLCFRDNIDGGDYLSYLGNVPYDEMPLSEFMSLETYSPVLNDFLGVYVICNESKNKFFVRSFESVQNGRNKQGNSLKDEVLYHFQGRGNKAIKRDYDDGNRFSIRLVRYKDRTIPTLKEFEHYNKEKYDSMKSGYNR